MKFKDIFIGKRKKPSGFVTEFNETPDHGLLIAQIAEFYDLAGDDLLDLYSDYGSFYKQKEYPAYFMEEKGKGERKHLCKEEAMLCYFAMERFRPELIVEIGTQYGVSTRKIIDIRNHLGIEANIECYDIEDQVKYFAADEATLNVQDVSSHLREEIFSKSSNGYLHLDAHPYYLTKDAILEAMRGKDWVVTVHDCGKGLCNPKMEISRDQPELISSQTGHWERHVLADVFGVVDPLSDELGTQQTSTHKMRIFETPHGGCTIIPKNE